MRTPLCNFLYAAFIVGSLFQLHGCSDPPTPRERGFPRVILPEHAYQSFDCPLCPFTFQYPTYGKVYQRKPDSCHFDIIFPEYGATWHLTLESLNEDYTYSDAYEKYHSMIFQHSGKGKIYEQDLAMENGTGKYFEIYGEVPTSAQVFFSDSVNYALEASLYFNSALHNDSLAPVIEFLKKDLEKMVQSLAWRPEFRRARGNADCGDDVKPIMRVTPL